MQDVTGDRPTVAALFEEKERYRVLAEGMPQIAWRSYDGGFWTWASQQWMDFTGQTKEQSLGLGWLDAIHPDDRAVVRQAWSEAPWKGQLDVESRIQLASGDEWRWHQTRAVPLRGVPGSDGPDGAAPEWVGVSNNIQDLKALQGRQNVLVAELQHRTRNMLSIIRNIARRSFTPSPARDEYDARLAALSRVQSFLSRIPTWSVPLAELISAEFEAIGSAKPQQVVVHGPSVDLLGDGIQPMALALHELATNAVKYGALSCPVGRLAITWQVEGADDSAQLRLEWRETGVPMPQGRPEQCGFGMELIERALPYQLKAQTRLQFTPDGVHCTIVLPAGAFKTASASRGEK